MLYGGQQHNPPSRFLSELGGDIQTEPVDGGWSGGEAAPSLFGAVDTNEARYVPDLNER